MQNETVIWSDWKRARASAEPGRASLSWLLEQVVSHLEQSELNQSDE